MRFESSIDVSLKYTVGPFEKQSHLNTQGGMSTLQMRNHSLDFFTSSFTTDILYPLSAAYPEILPISNLRSFFLLKNSSPRKTPTSPPKKLHVTLIALSEVVIRTFGEKF